MYGWMQGVRLLKVTDIDSHVFEPDDDRWLCFHANFSACFDGDKDISFFFTKVTRIKGPQFATSYVRLHIKSDTGVLCGTCQRNNKGNIANVCV